ncbi:MAG: hypothetical protein EP344_08140 [Bacteroidetes bacterium]|nr:MAG: hypothetical protein EP344_08140 [Bacteroidota bacterium]
MSQTKSALLPQCLFAFVLTLFTAPVWAQQTDDWELKNTKDGVKVYYRKTSDIYELKMVTSIKVPLSGFARLFDEVPNYTEWVYKVSESKELKKVSSTEMYYYTRIDFPWPLSDRDLVLHSKLEQSTHTNALIATSRAVSGWEPVKKDVVRMTNASTKWVLTPGKGGWIYVEYYLYSDPGGNLPDWAVNLALDVGPRETIKRMRKILSQPAYQNTKLAHIRE